MILRKLYHGTKYLGSSCDIFTKINGDKKNYFLLRHEKRITKYQVFAFYLTF